MAKIEDKIKLLLKEAEDRKLHAEYLSELLKIYPDLEYETDKINMSYHCSKSVNNLVNECDIRDRPYSGGTLAVYPYIITSYGKVHSNPYCITIGFDDFPSDNWKENLLKFDINQIIIDKCNNYFETCIQERIAETQERITKAKEELERLHKL